MADEREDKNAPRPADSVADKEKIQSAGRESNAAQPLNAAENRGGPERYPATDRTDAVRGEGRSFDPAAEAPAPRQGAGDDGPPHARTDGFAGPGGDPAEGKR